jgi:hypothetical protein
MPNKILLTMNMVELLNDEKMMTILTARKKGQKLPTTRKNVKINDWIYYSFVVVMDTCD